MKNFCYVNSIKLIVVLFFAFVTSCNTEIAQLEPDSNANAAISVKNGRLAFKDTKTLLDVLDKLKTLRTNEDALNWENQYKFTSLRKRNLDNPTQPLLNDAHLPLSFRAILNENAEYQVGNVIAWYNGLQVHFIKNLDEDQLQRIKQNPSLSKEKGSITVSKIDANSVQSDKVVNGTISAQSGDQRNAKYQHEWLMNNQSNDWRKTVYEIFSVTTMVGPLPNGTGYEDHYDFYMMAKFEWLWHGWQPNANENHVVQLQFSGWSQLNCNSSPTYFNYQENVYTRGDVQKVLASGSLYHTGGCDPGTITYSINGYISSDVYDPGTGVREVNSGYSTGVGNYPLWE